MIFVTSCWVQGIPAQGTAERRLTPRGQRSSLLPAAISEVSLNVVLKSNNNSFYLRVLNLKKAGPAYPCLHRTNVEVTSASWRKPTWPVFVWKTWHCLPRLSSQRPIAQKIRFSTCTLGLGKLARRKLGKLPGQLTPFPARPRSSNPSTLAVHSTEVLGFSIIIIDLWKHHLYFSVGSTLEHGLGWYRVTPARLVIHPLHEPISGRWERLNVAH